MEQLECAALEAKMHAYVPYSHYQVGAALVTKNGKIYTGCNIENDGIMSICAERVAFCKAISEGETDFHKICIVAGQENSSYLDLATPCGYCRQFMSEFVDSNFKVIVSNGKEKKEFSLAELLPEGFSFTK